MSSQVYLVYLSDNQAIFNQTNPNIRISSIYIANKNRNKINYRNKNRKSEQKSEQKSEHFKSVPILVPISDFCSDFCSDNFKETSAYYDLIYRHKICCVYKYRIFFGLPKSGQKVPLKSPC